MLVSIKSAKAFLILVKMSQKAMVNPIKWQGFYLGEFTRPRILRYKCF